ncbi:hypothetical protein PBY51_010718 [Eleginops maclovinus]|uniref:Uncharacterized protein n=1 Tax=Eleginops maclovinus TaxID=56733 RepID=A0AAN8AJS9_ELEMC|nr:hypothetical protein PBY51_010718 [Eleginops maclovinus]
MKKWRSKAEGRRMEGKIDADERKGNDRFRREVAREMWRDGSKERNRGRKPSRCSQHACLLRCRFSASAGGGRMTERPSNQSVTAGQNRTCLSQIQLCLFILL